jgi:hypothetical protein
MRIPRIVTVVLAVTSLCLPSAHADSTNLLGNPGFEQVGPDGPLTSFAGPPGGRAAAADWFIFNNTSAPTFSALIPSTLSGGSSEMMEVSTTTPNNGVAQDFLPAGTGPATTIDSIWVYVISGCVGMGVGNTARLIVEDASTCVLNQWIDLQANNGVSPADEFIVYAANVAATFFVDNASVVDPPSGPAAVPEPSALMLLGIGLSGLLVMRRRSPTDR